jgi:hypothetical protein
MVTWLQVEEIDERETEYMGFHRKRRLISPRDFASGWDKQYTEGIKEFRQKITNLKLEAVLDVGLQLRKLSEEMKLKVRRCCCFVRSVHMLTISGSDDGRS